MRSSLEQMERIAQYLSGRLSAEERADFEAEAAGDPLLQEQLDFQRDITRIMQRRALRTEINTVARQYGAGSGFSWIAVTVSVIVAAGGITAFLLMSSREEPQKRQATAIERTVGVPRTETSVEASPVSEERETETVHMPPPPIRLPFRKDGLDLFGALEQPFVPEPQVEAGPVSRQELAESFEKLDFLPEGFRTEALAQIPAAERSKWNDKRLAELYYDLGSGSAAAESRNEGYVTVRSWRKPVRMHIPGTLNRRSDYKGTAFGLVVDGKGDGMGNVTVEFLAYGDKKTVTTDASGRFAFGLYGKIATEAKFTVPGYGESSIPKALFQSGRETWFQVEASGKAQPEATGNKRVDGSCSVSPAALKALRSPEFLGTYIATKAFEKRVKALHMLENGQQLLDLYVDNLTQPLWKVDQLAAGYLTGESKKLFEGFAAEHDALPLQDLREQSYYSDLYREKRSVCERQTAASNPSDDTKKLVEHMKKFVAPCTD